MMDHRPFSDPFRRLFFLLGIGLTLFMPVTPASGQTQTDLTWSGEVRPRIYGRKPVQNDWDHWISMRTRLGLDARVPNGMGLFIQIQDVRFGGRS